MNRFVLTLFIGITVSATFLIGPNAHSAQLRPVRVAYSTPSAAQLPVVVALDAGYYEEFGLKVDLKSLASPQHNAGILSRSLDFSSTAMNNVLSAGLAGVDVKILFNAVPFIAMTMYVRPEINDAKKLIGKKIGQTGQGPGISRSTSMATLRALGLDPEKDVEFAVLPSSAMSVQALIANTVQAVALANPQDVIARKAGMHVLYDISKDKIPLPSNVVWVTGEYLSKNRDIAVAFVKAYLKALQKMKQDKEYTMKVFGKYNKTDDKEVQESAWIYTVNHLPDNPLTTTEGIKAVLDILAANNPKARGTDIDTKKFFTNDILIQAQKELKK